MEKQKGFKALREDMTTKYGNMTYELRKVYHENNIELCARGFHYCEDLFGTLVFYFYKNSRFFEIEASGQIITGEDKSVCSDIKIVREICKKDIEKYIYDNIDILLNKYSDNYNIKCEIIKNFNMPIRILKELSNNEDWNIKKAVAENPNTPVNILKKLSDDKDWGVKRAVAENSNTPINILKKLSNNENWKLRMGVANNPNTPVNILEKLSHDEDYDVKKAAQQNLQKRNK